MNELSYLALDTQLRRDSERSYICLFISIILSQIDVKTTTFEISAFEISATLPGSAAVLACLAALYFAVMVNISERLLISEDSVAAGHALESQSSSAIANTRVEPESQKKFGPSILLRQKIQQGAGDQFRVWNGLYRFAVVLIPIRASILLLFVFIVSFLSDGGWLSI